MNTINPAQGNPQLYQGTMPQTQTTHEQEKTQQAQAHSAPQGATQPPAAQANNPTQEATETHEADHDKDNTVGTRLNAYA